MYAVVELNGEGKVKKRKNEVEKKVGKRGRAGQSGE